VDGMVMGEHICPEEADCSGARIAASRCRKDAPSFDSSCKSW